MDKIEVIDKLIEPLMEQISDICEEHQLEFFSAFKSEERITAFSGILKGGHPVFRHMEKLAESTVDEKINMALFQPYLDFAEKRGYHCFDTEHAVGVAVDGIERMAGRDDLLGVLSSLLLKQAS